MNTTPGFVHWHDGEEKGAFCMFTTGCLTVGQSGAPGAEQCSLNIERMFEIGDLHIKRHS